LIRTHNDQQLKFSCEVFSRCKTNSNESQN